MWMVNNAKTGTCRSHRAYRKDNLNNAALPLGEK